MTPRSLATSVIGFLLGPFVSVVELLWPCSSHRAFRVCLSSRCFTRPRTISKWVSEWPLERIRNCETLCSMRRLKRVPLKLNFPCRTISCTMWLSCWCLSTSPRESSAFTSWPAWSWESAITRQGSRRLGCSPASPSRRGSPPEHSKTGMTENGKMLMQNLCLNYLNSSFFPRVK